MQIIIVFYRIIIQTESINIPKKIVIYLKNIGVNGVIKLIQDLIYVLMYQKIYLLTIVIMEII